MTDIDKIGFGVDTQGLNTLNQQLDQTKQNVKGLNEELQRTQPAGQSAASSINQVSTAVQGVKGADQSVKGLADGMARVGDSAKTTASAVTQATQSVATGMDQASSKTKDLSQIIQDLATRSGASFADMQRTVQQMAGAAGASVEQMAQKMSAAFDRSSIAQAATQSIKQVETSATAVGAAADATGVKLTKMAETISAATAKTAGMFDGMRQAIAKVETTASQSQTTIGTSFNSIGQAIAKANRETVTFGDQMRAAFQGVQSDTARMGASINAAITQSTFAPMTRSIAELHGVIKEVPPSVEGFTETVNKNSDAHRGLSTYSMAAQHSVRSLVESIAMGIPVTQAMTGQMNHLSYAASGPGGLTGAFGEIARMIGPTGLIVGGIAAVGAGLLFLDYKFEESGAAAEKFRKRLEGLTEVKAGDKIAAEFEKAVKGAEHLPKELAPAVESLIKLQQIDPRSFASLSQGFREIGDDARASIDPVKTLYESLRLGGADPKDAGEATTKFFKDLAREGKVTAQMFQDLQETSPATAKALANAFTGGDISATRFAESLKNTPITIAGIVTALDNMKSKTDAAYRSMADNPKTLGEAVDRLKNKFSDLGESITKVGESKSGPGFVTQAVIQLGNAVEGWAIIAKKAQAAWLEYRGQTKAAGEDTARSSQQIRAASSESAESIRTVGQAAEQSSGFLDRLGDAVRASIDQVIGVIKSGFSEMGQSIADWASRSVGYVVDSVKAMGGAISDWATRSVGYVVDGVKGMVDSLADWFNRSVEYAKNWGGALIDGVVSGVTGAIQPIIEFVNNALDWINKLVDGAIYAAQRVADAIAAIGNAFSGGGGSGSFDATGSSTGVSDGNVQGFATGGSFVVGGSGGIDSQLIQFMATPGERVTIDQPGNGGQSEKTLGSLMPAPASGTAEAPAAQSDIATSKLDNALKQQTATIKDFEQANSAAIVGAVANSTAQIVAAVKAIVAPASSNVSASSSGTGTTSSSSSSPYSATSVGGGGGGTGSKSKNDGEFGTPWSLNDSKSSSSQSDQSSGLIDPLTAIGIARGMGGPVGATHDIQKENAAAAKEQAEQAAALRQWRGMGGNPNDIGQGIPIYPDDGKFKSSSTSTVRSTSRSGSSKPEDSSLGNMKPTSPWNNLSDSYMQGTGLKSTMSEDEYLRQTGLKSPLSEQQYLQDTGLRSPLSSGALNGMPVQQGVPNTGSIGPTYGTQRDAANVANGVAPAPYAKGTGDVKEQTQALKQSQDSGSKTVADKVQQQTQETKSIGEKTNAAMSDTANAAKDTASSTDDVAKSTDEGNDQAKQIGSDTTKGIDEGTEATKGVSDTTQTVGDATQQSIDQSGTQVSDATTQGSGNIVSKLDEVGNSIANSVGEAIASEASNNASSSSSSDGSSFNGGGGSFDSGSSGDLGGGSTNPGGGDFTNQGGDLSTGYATGGQFQVRGFASGGQFAVTGKGHADTELVQFMASPGETVTITPPGANPPPNPSFDSHKSNGPKAAYATGGQTTLGGMFGTPDVAVKSANLVAASVGHMLGEQSQNLGSKIDLVGQSIIHAIAGSTSSIMGAVNQTANAIPSGQSGFATGGQFKVSGLRGFATGGQVTVGGSDAASVGTDTLSSGLGTRMQQATAGVKDKLDTLGGRIVASLSDHTNSIIGGIDNIKARFDAYRSAAAASARSSSSGSSGSHGGSFATGSGRNLDWYEASLVNQWGIPANPAEAARLLGNGFISSAGYTPTQAMDAAGYNFATGGQFKVGAGNMAEGGAFTVPGGQSGADTVDVAIKASPGEKIFVLPPAEAAKFKDIHNQIRPSLEPISDFLPQPASVPGNDNATVSSGAVRDWKGASPYLGQPVAASQAGGAGGPPVIIQVQKGVQADDFIRSRAQIQRSMGR